MARVIKNEYYRALIPKYPDGTNRSLLFTLSSVDIIIVLYKNFKLFNFYFLNKGVEKVMQLNMYLLHHYMKTVL